MVYEHFELAWYADFKRISKTGTCAINAIAEQIKPKNLNWNPCLTSRTYQIVAENPPASRWAATQTKNAQLSCQNRQGRQMWIAGNHLMITKDELCCAVRCLLKFRSFFTRVSKTSRSYSPGNDPTLKKKKKIHSKTLQILPGRRFACRWWSADSEFSLK